MGFKRQTRVVLAVVGTLLAVACVPDPLNPPDSSTTTSSTTTTTLLPASSFMYVAATNLGAILKIDTATLATVATYDVGGPLGQSVALQGNRLYYATAGSQWSTIGMYDMSTGANNRAYLNSPVSFYSPILRTSPALPGKLFVGAGGLSPFNIQSWDVASATPVKLAQTQHLEAGSNLKDFEFSTDGTRLWTASGAPYQIVEFRTSDLLLSGKSYPTGPYPVAVAHVGTGGSEVIGAGAASNTNSYMFQATNPAATVSFPIGGGSVDRGVAFSLDGTKVFAAVTNTKRELVTIDRVTGATTRANLSSTAAEANGFDTGDLGVDPGTGRVFATLQNSVVVFNPDGTYRTTLTQAAPRGFVFSTSAPAVTPPPVITPTTTTTTTTSTTTTTTTTTTVPNANPPTVSAFAATALSGAAPLSTAFTWTVNDPDPQPLTCSIDLEDNGVYDITINGCNSSLSRSATFATAGARTVRFRVSDGVSTATRTLSVSVGAPSADSFAINVRFNGALTSSQQAAFSSAATRWAQVIKTGLADQTINASADACAAGHPDFVGGVDDLMIDAIVTPIDGVGGVLGSAGPCVVRSGGLPIYGVMQFDSADLASLEADGLLSTVVLHEMGHVLGIGTRWSAAGLISGSGGTNPLFVGNVAKGAWSAIGGGSTSVPVEATGGAGTAYGHWRESVFNNELMTGWINNGSNPLSAITAGSLADLGYGVDLTKADAFGLPALRAPGSTGYKLETQLIEPEFFI